MRSLTRRLAPSARLEVLPAAAAALAGYVAVRLVGLLVLWLMARHFGGHISSLLAKWDGRWFIDVAQDGYDTTLSHRSDGSLVNTNIVFFPGYPYVIKAVSAVTGLSVLWAGVVTAWVAGVAAAWGIFAVGATLYDRRVGSVLVVLWGIQTHAVVESMVYSEGLFTALCAWSLYALQRRRWLTAGTLCLLAGTTRAAAVVLVVVVVLAAVVAGRRDGWRPWLAAILAPLGLLGYLAWVGHALGRWDGWLYMQRSGWYLSFDGGSATVRTVVHRVLFEATRLELYEVTSVLAASVVLVVLLAFMRPPWPLFAYAVGFLVLTIGGAGYYHAKARFLLPAFPLLLPVALALGRARIRVAAVTLSAVALASAWYGGYLLLLWTASP
jgi:hypothetical protein